MLQEAVHHEMRPVTPLPALDELAAFDEPAEREGPEEYSLLVHPLTRRLMNVRIRSADAGTIIGVFDALRAAAEAEGERRADLHAQGVARLERRISELRDAVWGATLIASEMRALVYLFDKALDDDGRDDDLTAASRIVSSCIRSMAGRLAALETHAAAVGASPEVAA